MNIAFPLNETQLVFLPVEATGRTDPFMAQITVKTDRAQDVANLIEYTLAQREISEAILRLVLAHMDKRLPRTFVVSGDNYRLIAGNKEWTYGRELDVRWGDTRVRPCKDKWTFIYQQELAQDKPDVE